MGYVMVPVPEEHAEEIGHFVMTLTLKGKLDAWPDGAVSGLLEACDDVDHRVLHALATSSAMWCTAPDIAAATAVEVDDLIARVEAMNAICYKRPAPPIVMVREDGGGRQSLLMSGRVRNEVARLTAPPA